MAGFETQCLRGCGSLVLPGDFQGFYEEREVKCEEPEGSPSQLDLISSVFMRRGVCVCMLISTCMVCSRGQRSEDNLRELVLFFYHVSQRLNSICQAWWQVLLLSPLWIFCPYSRPLVLYA